jgi:uncharacterized OsmC-like protein
MRNGGEKCMKIRVSYSELKTENYNNRRAEAEIEFEVHGDLNEAFENAWRIVKKEVKKQIEPHQFHNDLPF